VCFVVQPRCQAIQSHYLPVKLFASPVSYRVPVFICKRCPLWGRYRHLLGTGIVSKSWLPKQKVLQTLGRSLWLANIFRGKSYSKESPLSLIIKIVPIVCLPAEDMAAANGPEPVLWIRIRIRNNPNFLAGSESESEN
jgi:hypothetical protein